MRTQKSLSNSSTVVGTMRQSVLCFEMNHKTIENPFIWTSYGDIQDHFSF